MARKERSEPKVDHDKSKRALRIISRLRRGKITPREAEAELKRRGQPPLIQSPDTQQYDPRSKTLWTSLQTVAWIAFRDIEVVLRVTKEYRAKKTTLNEIGPPGAKPARLDKVEVAGPRTTVALDLHVASRGLPGETIERAIQLLRSALQAKRIVASGICNGVRKEIDALFWADLRFFVDREEPETVVYQRMRFEEVRVPREDVMRMWPEPQPKNSPDSGPANVIRSTAPLHKPRKPGRRPTAYWEVITAMNGDLREGKITATQLDNCTEQALAKQYNRSRPTVRKARNVILDRIRANNLPNPTISDAPE
jgi:hypothetical protein